ncbi:MAG: TolC family protein [Thermodesulfobacteriota bacterium]
MGKLAASRRIWVLAAMLLALVWAAGPAGAADPLAKNRLPQGVVTLQQALNMALDYSPNIQQYLALLDKASSQKKEAFTYFLPTLGTTYGYLRYQNPPETRVSATPLVAGTDDNYYWSTYLRQPLFTGFRLSSQYQLTRLGVDLAETNLTLAYLDVAFSVKENYFGYLRAIKGVEVAREAVRLLEAQLKVSRDFYDVGIIPINDVLKTEVSLSDAKQELVRAVNAQALSMSRLNRLLGLPVEHDLKVQDILKAHPLQMDYQRARLTARNERPEIKAVKLQIQQADQSIRQAQSGYWPQLSLKASYDFASDSPDLGDSRYNDATNWSVTTQLDWSFWEWGRTGHQTSQQRADKRRLEAVQRNLEDEVDLQVKEALLALRESQENIVTATTGIKQAEENYRITFERYREQLTTNTELLDAQLLLSRARNNYYNALAVFNVAEARLQRSMGRGLAGLAFKPLTPDRSFWP